MNQLAQECTINWVHKALEKNIDLGFEGSLESVTLLGDAINLTEMLNNLIDNAILYTQEGCLLYTSDAADDYSV